LYDNHDTDQIDSEIKFGTISVEPLTLASTCQRERKENEICLRQTEKLMYTLDGVVEVFRTFQRTDLALTAESVASAKHEGYNSQCDQHAALDANCGPNSRNVSDSGVEK
jgi:hypothetical protein